MKLKWTCECYKCKAPLFPSICNTTGRERRIISYYKRIRPLFMINNELRYSFVGGHIKRVCYWCFVNKPKHIHRSLRERELGRRAYVRSGAKSASEICQWFDGLMRYSQKQT